jgi:hypothetical protein
MTAWACIFACRGDAPRREALHSKTLEMPYLGEVASPCICLECRRLRAGATSGILAHVYCVASRQTKGLEQARKPTLSNHAASRSGERNPREKSTCLVLDHSLIIRSNVSAP